MMKSLAVVSMLVLGALMAAPAGAQLAGSPIGNGQAPGPQWPAAGTQPEELAPTIPPQAIAPDGAPFEGPQLDAPELPIAPGDETAAPAPLQQGDQLDAYPQAGAYAQPDLGPDNEIAQSYDDGYDPQAYEQFESALAPYGSWVDDPTYGNVWWPSASVVGAGFLPYASGGHWLLSEYGWTWVSDWSWGWAPFHYGRWTTVAGRGWCWVPGTMWGPAWVSWRSGGGYVGWAPLPPRGTRLFAGVGPRSPWRFAAAGSLGAAHPTFYGGRNLPGLFARTTVVANDRLLTRGSWTVHVNAGPTRGLGVAPVHLSSVAPRALPRIAVYPRAGASIGSRPWARAATPTPAWHAGVPSVGAAGHAPNNAGSVRSTVGSPAGGWSRTAPYSRGVTGTPARPYSSASAPSNRTPGQQTPNPVYQRQGREPTTYRYPAGASSYGAATRAPAYSAAPSYAPARNYAPQPAPAYAPEHNFAPPRAYAPSSAYQSPSYAAPRSYAPPAGGGRSFGSSSSFGSAGSHFGGGGGGASHFGGGGGGRRR